MESEGSAQMLSALSDKAGIHRDGADAESDAPWGLAVTMAASAFFAALAVGYLRHDRAGSVSESVVMMLGVGMTGNFRPSLYACARSDWPKGSRCDCWEQGRALLGIW